MNEIITLCHVRCTLCAKIQTLKNAVSVLYNNMYNGFIAYSSFDFFSFKFRSFYFYVIFRLHSLALVFKLLSAGLSSPFRVLLLWKNVFTQQSKHRILVFQRLDLINFLFIIYLIEHLTNFKVLFNSFLKIIMLSFDVGIALSFAFTG